jgi:hypothetical protein
MRLRERLKGGDPDLTPDELQVAIERAATPSHLTAANQNSEAASNAPSPKATAETSTMSESTALIMPSTDARNP